MECQPAMAFFPSRFRDRTDIGEYLSIGLAKTGEILLAQEEACGFVHLFYVGDIPHLPGIVS